MEQVDVDVSRYDRIGVGYDDFRRPDPRIERAVSDGLGAARRVVNVGAGTGSYEPTDRTVIAVEPSSEMIRQRRAHAASVVRATSIRLPFRDGVFDAALTVLSIHHWSDRRAGLLEMRRVARTVVVLTWDPDHPGFWLTQEYFPDLIAIDRKIFPSMAEFADVLGPVGVTPVMIPRDCSDGFLGAYWVRPRFYLDPRARRAISSFSRIGDVASRIDALAADLESGRWARRHPELDAMGKIDLGYRLVVTRP